MARATLLLFLGGPYHGVTCQTEDAVPPPVLHLSQRTPVPTVSGADLDAIEADRYVRNGTGQLAEVGEEDPVRWAAYRYTPDAREEDPVG